MADFKTAFDLMIAHEGGYVNDPSDPGGETWKGISRNNHPGWIGWHTIDLLKVHRSFPDMLYENRDLQKEVGYFYETKFWGRISGSLISEQAIANSIFDFAVNAGTKTSAGLAQEAVGFTGDDVDGIIGIKTAEAINGFEPELFKALFTLKKIRRYVEICNKRPLSKKYFFGWIVRAIS